MGVFDRQRALATRLIAKYGQSVIWRERALVGDNPAKPSGSAPIDNAVKIVFLSPKLQIFDLFQTFLDKTEIPTGGVVGLMGPVSFIPTLAGQVIRGNETYTLTGKNGIDVLDPNGEGVILYRLRFQR
jgi:hypothetical protein